MPAWLATPAATADVHTVNSFHFAAPPAELPSLLASLSRHRAALGAATEMPLMG